MRPIHHLAADIIGPPRAWARTRLTGRDGKIRRYNPKGYTEWKEENAEKLRALAGYRTFVGEIAVLVDVHHDGYTIRVASIEQDDQRRTPTGLTGDIDNYAKAILDALQAGKVITNDNQVAELTVRFRPQALETTDAD